MPELLWRKERNECEVITEGAPADQELAFSAFLLYLWPLQISQIKSLIIYEGESGDFSGVGGRVGNSTSSHVLM